MAHLEGIRQGKISLAYRKWKTAAVKSGSELRTAVGVLHIHKVDKIQADQINDHDARQAGYKDAVTLLTELDKRDGQLFRIRLSYQSEDPRIALRTNDELPPEEMEKVFQRLKSMDRKTPWTAKVLQTIAGHPEVRAADIAHMTGFEKEWLKIHIRRLKDLGLTESLDTGYRISPRGKIVLKVWLKQQP